MRATNRKRGKRKAYYRCRRCGAGYRVVFSRPWIVAARAATESET